MRSGKMSEKQFKIINELGDYHLLDGDEELCYDLCSLAMAKENWDNVVEKLNELNTEREYLIGERGKLETKNVLLRKENEQLKKELSECEKFRYSVFKRIEKTIESKDNCVLNKDAKSPCKDYDKCLKIQGTNKPLPCVVNWLMGRPFENMLRKERDDE